MNTAPAVKIARPANTTTCSSSMMVLYTAASNVKTYQWLMNGASISGATGDSLIVTQTGKYTVVVNSAAGCNSNDTIGITVNATPVSAFSVPSHTVCAGTSLSFFNESYVVSGSSLHYIWTFGDNDSSKAASPSYTYAKAGKYYVNLWAISAKGCNSVMEDSITVLDVNSSKFTNIGIGYARVVFAASDTTGSTYEWNFGDNTIGSGKLILHDYAASGSYSVSLTVTNKNGCSTTTTSTINVNSTGIAPTTSSDISINVFPNPFTTKTNVVYTLNESSTVGIEVLDITGKRVAFVENSLQPAGNHTYVFSGQVPGAYFIKMVINDKLYVNKVVQQ
jgi:PKD repeat protein